MEKTRALIEWYTITLSYRIVFVNLHLHSTFGSKFRYHDTVSHLFEVIPITARAQTIIVSMKIRCRNYEIQVYWLQLWDMKDSRSEKYHWNTHTLLESNVRGSGARFGPLQNGWPVEETASRGRLNNNCWMLKLNFSSNCNLAQTTHSSSVRGLSFTRYILIWLIWSKCWLEYFRLVSK